MICPICKTAEEIRIQCMMPVNVYVDREGNVIDSSDVFDGYEWGPKTAASCGNCEFDGTVADLIMADPEDTHEKVLTGQCPICRHYGDDCVGAEPEQLANGQHGYPSNENPIA